MKGYKSTTKESEKDCAQTPIWFIESVEKLYGKKFDLDACSLPTTRKCQDYYSLENGEDGLLLPWQPLTWCNPPFSDILPWLEKAFLETLDGNHSFVIFPDNPETKYSRYAWDNADTIIRMPFRLQFLRPNGESFRDRKGKVQSPQFPCVLANFTPIGQYKSTQCFYHDFR